MIFTDEDTQIKFHKALTSLQQISHTFESLCLGLGTRIAVVDVLEENKAFFVLEDDRPGILETAQELMNQRFSRHDGFLTCSIQDGEPRMAVILSRAVSDYRPLS
jgi:hypothetical protein